MANMPYCRFENTDAALADCQSTLEQFYEGNVDEVLSTREAEHAARLLARCVDIVQQVAEATCIPVTELCDGPEHPLELFKRLVLEHNNHLKSLTA